MATRYDTADEKWVALTTRDASADGSFFYAVKTTGIFCRPSCASRRPRRENVEWFAAAAEAAARGYRPCKRCRPTSEQSPGPGALLVRACRLLEAGDGPSTNQAVARHLGVTAAHLQRLFQRHMGITPQAFRRRVLAERARARLAGAASVTTAAYDAGYSTSSRFYAGAGQELGMTPRQMRKGAPDEHVRCAVRRCSLGFLLVAWTDRGVCDVELGDAPDALIADLRTRIFRARVDEAADAPWVEEILAAVERPRSLNVPLDIEGTAFQQRVWRELMRIPPGETRTYTEVARAIGAPTATRAVARACATNRVAVVVPCHRVVRADGGLAGYRWGRARKEELLRREAED